MTTGLATGADADIQLNISELRHRARCLFERLDSCDFSDVLAYYRACGLDQHAAESLLLRVVQFVCLSAAWRTLHGAGQLGLGGDAGRVGVQGFLLHGQGLREVEKRLPGGVDYRVAGDGDVELADRLLTHVFGEAPMK